MKTSAKAHKVFALCALTDAFIRKFLKGGIITMNMIYTAEDGTKIAFDEWEEFEEDGKVLYYWGSICGKCIEKFGRYKLRSHLSDGSTACCSVCGCDTPGYWDSLDDNDGMMYIDFQPNEVTFE